jgi:hypothetical protein
MPRARMGWPNPMVLGGSSATPRANPINFIYFYLTLTHLPPKGHGVARATPRVTDQPLAQK